MKATLKVLIFGLIVLIGLSSCATNNLSISVVEPAPVALPVHVKRVGVINRTLPSDENKTLDKIDKVFSVEGKDLDKDGAQQAITGLFTELGKNDRFDEVVLIEKDEIRSPGLGIFPAPLSWEEVDLLCKENNVDAIFSLVLYDTDANVAFNAIPVKINTAIGVSLPALEHSVVITTLIKPAGGYMIRQIS